MKLSLSLAPLVQKLRSPISGQDMWLSASERMGQSCYAWREDGGETRFKISLPIPTWDKEQLERVEASMAMLSFLGQRAAV